MIATTNTCCKKIYDNYGSYTCGKKAKFERDNKHYCGTHDPVAVAAKVKARNDKWKADIHAMTEKRKAAAEVTRRAECYDDLLESLQVIRQRANENMNDRDTVYAMHALAVAAFDHAKPPVVIQATGAPA